MREKLDDQVMGIRASNRRVIKTPVLIAAGVVLLLIGLGLGNLLLGDSSESSADPMVPKSYVDKQLADLNAQLAASNQRVEILKAALEAASGKKIEFPAAANSAAGQASGSAGQAGSPAASQGSGQASGAGSQANGAGNQASGAAPAGNTAAGTTSAGSNTAGANTGEQAKNAVVELASINVRFGPSTEYTKVVTLAKGQKVSVLQTVKNDQGETWYKIRSADGKEGFVRNDLVKLN